MILEALTIGIIASVIGLFGGLGLAWALNRLFEALELDLPQADTVFATRTIVVSLLVGVLVTLLAGLFPAIRATRVPPIAAVREGATLPKSRFSRFTPFVAIGAIVLALFLLGFSMFKDELATGDRLLSIAGGVLLLFVGVAMISSRLVRPIAAVVGWPARQTGRRGRQARARELGAQPGPHGGDRSGAHDRHRARHVRGRPRRGAQVFEPRGDRGPDRRRLRRHVPGRLHALRGGRGRGDQVRPRRRSSSRASGPTWARSETPTGT